MPIKFLKVLGMNLLSARRKDAKMKKGKQNRYAKQCGVSVVSGMVFKQKRKRDKGVGLCPDTLTRRS